VGIVALPCAGWLKALFASSSRRPTFRLRILGDLQAMAMPIGMLPATLVIEGGPGECDGRYRFLAPGKEMWAHQTGTHLIRRVKCQWVLSPCDGFAVDGHGFTADARVVGEQLAWQGRCYLWPHQVPPGQWRHDRWSDLAPGAAMPSMVVNAALCVMITASAALPGMGVLTITRTGPPRTPWMRRRR
jgi:hypothetical protein